MKITIVIATFNAEKYVAECLESCLSQTWPDVEIVVMDGGSRDQTVAILERYASRLAYWESTPDKGIYDAWNKALQHATGEWVIFRGVDDCFWSPDSLAQIAPRLQACAEDVLFAYGALVCVDGNDRFVGLSANEWKSCEQRLEQGMNIPHPSCFHRRSAFSVVGLFDSNLKLAGDYDWLLRAVRHGTAASLVDVIVTKMRTGGVTGRQFIVSVRESIRARRNSGRNDLPWRLYAQIIRHYWRRCLEVAKIKPPVADDHAMPGWDRLKDHPSWPARSTLVLPPTPGAEG